MMAKGFAHFHYFKTMSNIFQKSLISEGYFVGLSLGHNTRKNCVSCPYHLKASLYLFKRVNKTFLLKNVFNWESSNLF